jgi:lipopolysaccharide biosynthesis glycosyltransferase
MNKLDNSKTQYLHSLNNQKDTLNIVLGFDDNMALGAGVLLTSIALNNQDINLNFHLFLNNVAGVYLTQFAEFASKYQVNLTTYQVDDDILDFIPNLHYLSKATNIRIIALEYLAPQVDKILYLDSDMLCVASLKGLCELDFQNKTACVVLDIANFRAEKACQFKLPALKNSYFNAGFLFISSDKWLELKVLDFIKSHNLKVDNDQDFLNILLLNQTLSISAKYNTLFSIDTFYLKNKKVYKENFDDFYIIHFVGVTKPWHKWASDINDNINLFLSYKNRSLWADNDLMATNRKTYKYQAKHIMKRNSFLSPDFWRGLGYYLKYKFGLI